MVTTGSFIIVPLNTHNTKPFFCLNTSSLFQIGVMSYGSQDITLVPPIWTSSISDSTCDLSLENRSICIATSETLGSLISSSAPRVCLRSLIPMDIQELTEVMLSPTQNTVGLCQCISIPILHKVHSGLVTFVKRSYAFIQVSNILVPAVC